MSGRERHASQEDRAMGKRFAEVQVQPRVTRDTFQFAVTNDGKLMVMLTTRDGKTASTMVTLDEWYEVAARGNELAGYIRAHRDDLADGGNA